MAQTSGKISDGERRDGKGHHQKHTFDFYARKEEKSKQKLICGPGAGCKGCCSGGRGLRKKQMAKSHKDAFGGPAGGQILKSLANRS
ncbi:hypothetical protein [Desulfoluna spongiiphila]|uniref:hypothetical protein n=1 Tax=Desulfoluna spongiiphila TaxID=419481 RepID=UPI00125FF928|nr:hypothetical protein [Desulfoluna spongiiphila]